ncbi:MAG: DUF1145 domain-containing protein [Alcanivoracaceae bacterium]
MLMKAGRIGTLIFWVIVLAGVAGVLPGGLNQLMRNLGILILLAHFAEVGLMYTTLRERLKPTLKDAALVMVYGAFYLKPKLDASR